MRSGLVIVLPPVINNFPGMKNIAEPVLIQTFIPKAAVIVRHSFVKSSKQVRHLIRRPLASASMTKSIDHVRLFKCHLCDA
ncbi:hypothetical protein UF13_19975 [Pantoea agglomerans]|nr:hypothetical protein UF13_19975 [Pantoea agglomerans]